MPHILRSLLIALCAVEMFTCHLWAQDELPQEEVKSTANVDVPMSATTTNLDTVAAEATAEPGVQEMVPTEEIWEQPESILDAIEERPTIDHYDNRVGWHRPPEWSKATWIPGRKNGLGVFSLEGVSSFVVDDWKGLSITSGHGFHFLDGPTQTDLPPRLFDFNGGLHWFGEVASGWWADLSVSAGIYTDFEESAREGWRFPAHAVVSWEYSSAVHPVLGVRYFDRNDLGLLPVAGFILRPDDAVRLELLFPDPRLSWRISTNSEGDEECWLSIAGRIGGGEWAIERAGTGLADTATYDDYQLVVGFERVKQDGSVSQLKLGYAFERELEYRSGLGDFEPAETLFLQWSTQN